MESGAVLQSEKDGKCTKVMCTEGEDDAAGSSESGASL